MPAGAEIQWIDAEARPFESVDRADVADTDEREFSTLYQKWFREVTRWLFALGIPESEAEDLAQEIFVVVRRDLPKFDGQNLFGWLYKITQNTASDHRRRAWFRKFFLRPRNVELEQIEDMRRTPYELLDEKDASRLVRHLLEGVNPKKRVAFVLFELEGYSGEEIAALEEIPLATVWSRIRHARAELTERLLLFRNAGKI